MKKVIDVDVEFIKKVQNADLKYRTLTQVAANVVEAHSMNDRSNVLDTPVFNGFIDKVSQAGVDFDKLRDSVTNTLIPEEERDRVESWSLNYSACTLTYILRDE